MLPDISLAKPLVINRAAVYKMSCLLERNYNLAANISRREGEAKEAGGAGRVEQFL